jgi:hypothetical protein
MKATPSSPVLFLSFFVAAIHGLVAHADDLRVSDNKRFIAYEDGAPFFYLADTAWELLHRLDREETETYLQNRDDKGFTVIQTVALAELDGLRVPNAFGELPFIDLDPAKPNEAYWRHVDWVVDRANELGLFVGLLPTWGDKWNQKWGVGPEIFTPTNARAYGEWIARRYADKNVIWILGGDRPLETLEHWKIIQAMAEGVNVGDGGRGLITYHPGGNQNFVTTLHKEPWLDFTMIQSGHGETGLKNYQRIEELYSLPPTKPVMDAEPCYEAHPVMGPSWRWSNGFRYTDFHARRAAYWNVFSGACGHTYGASAVWQMYDAGRHPENHPADYWHEEIHLPGSGQLATLRKLVESRPYLARIPAAEMIVAQPDDPIEYIVATRDAEGSYAFVYSPMKNEIEIDLTALSAGHIRAAWFDPRTGDVEVIGEFAPSANAVFKTPETGPDWVLILDDLSRNYPLP